jgi:hypothetical protein
VSKIVNHHIIFNSHRISAPNDHIVTDDYTLATELESSFHAIGLRVSMPTEHFVETAKENSLNHVCCTLF